jgi:hypothetical protein
MDAGLELSEHDSPALSAGFTFLAQFLDHDLDFDPTSSLERQADPSAINNFRTPALDLDNVYGAGPSASPHLYDSSPPGGTLLLVNGSDLARNSQETALIGDPRNDENMIVSQLELAFMKCHNAIVAGLVSGKYNDAFGASATTNEDTSGGESTVFLAGQQLLRWHYQWMIIHEFLPLICGSGVVNDVLTNGPTFFKPSKVREPFIPVEFSVAAYRFGHATIRSEYIVNDEYTLPLFPTNPGALTNPRTDLRGGPVDPSFTIKWANFFNRDPSKPAQRAKRIEPLLNSLLLDLPNGIIPGNTVAPLRSLAARNLLRSEALMLPTGQDVARALGVDEVLNAEDLRNVAQGAGGKTLPLTDEELRNVYLWYYLLAEAYHQHNGDRLGDAGARIVAEVFVGVIDADALSFRNMFPNWSPTLPSINPGEFTIVDLLDLAGV